MTDAVPARTIELEDETLGAVRGERTGDRWSWDFPAADVDFEDHGLGDLPADVTEETVRERVARLAATVRRIVAAEPALRRFAAEELVDVANSWTREDADEGLIGSADVVREPADIERRITASSVTWNAVEGEGWYWYDDDEIFAHHSISVDFSFAADGALVPKEAKFQG